MAIELRQFQVYHANLKDQITRSSIGVQGGIRPVLILSNDEFMRSSPVINVVPMTSQTKNSPVHLEVYMECKDRKSYLLFEQIMTINKCSLQSFDGIYDTQYVDMIWDRLDFQLGRFRDPEHRTRLFALQPHIPHIFMKKVAFI